MRLLTQSSSQMRLCYLKYALAFQLGDWASNPTRTFWKFCLSISEAFHDMTWDCQKQKVYFRLSFYCKQPEFFSVNMKKGVMNENNLLKEVVIRLYLSFEFPYLPPLDSFTATACFHLLI